MATLDQKLAALAAVQGPAQPLTAEQQALKNTQTASAGQVVRDDGSAGVQNPQQATAANGRVVNVGQANQTILNSQYVATNGTKGSTLSTTTSQGTPASSVTVVAAPQVNQNLAATNSAGTPTQNAGVGAARDDNSAATKNTTQQTVNSIFNTPIVAQPNVLDKYVDYTYSVSWYLLTPNQAADLSNSGTRNLANWQLLVQSAGIPVGTRNQYFQQDYYIDNLEISSAIHGKGTGSAHNATNMTWTVTEPNGLTLLNNLYSAVVDLYKKANITDNPNYVKATYCIVIRFYGYDENGNLDLHVGNRGNSIDTNKTAPTAVVEKFYPVLISNISFQLANKAVEYKIEATPIPYNINRGTFRGTIPFNYELVGTSLQDIFNGKTARSATTVTNNGTTINATTTTTTFNPVTSPPAPANASNAPSGTTDNVFTGLCEALNAHQQQLVKDGIYEVADVYSIEFTSSSIANATVKKPGNTDFSATPMQQAKTPAGQLDPKRNSVNTAGRTVPVTAGMQIIQFIEQQLRASSYISDQLTYITDEKTGQQVPNLKNTNGQTAWYKINFQAIPIPGKYDNKRRDLPYRIKYVISPFAINTMQSEYFADSKFRGVHKSYYYWFTGQNTQVLNYSQTINSLYAVVMTGKQALNAEKVTGRDQISKTFMAASGQSSQGADKQANEPGASGADYLYSMADLANINLKIVGDPAWLQQGEAAGIINTAAFNLKPFNDDGTINFDASQITFDISWNCPVDYNFDTGLMEVSGKTSTSGTLNQAQEHATYLATEVKSQFNKGKFEQDLVGTIIPQSVTKADAAVAQGATLPDVVSAITNSAPLTAGAVAAQLGIPSLNNIGSALGNAATSLGNYIRDPLKNITSDGRLTQATVPTPSNTNQATPVQMAESQPLPTRLPSPLPTSDGAVVSYNTRPNSPVIYTDTGLPGVPVVNVGLAKAAPKPVATVLSDGETVSVFSEKARVNANGVNPSNPQLLNRET